MKKSLLLIMFLFLSLIAVSCNKDKTITMEYLYKNMNLAYKEYKKIYSYMSEIVSHQYIILNDLVEEDQNNLKKDYGEELVSMIILWDKDNIYRVVALEYSSIESAQNQLNIIDEVNYKSYFRQDKFLLLNAYPSYILLDGGYVEDGDFVYNKNKDILLYTTSDSECIIIPEGVKEIAGFAFFSENNKIKEVKCNNELEIIGAAAFYWCVFLEKVILNDNIKFIGDMAFANDFFLEYIIIPSSIEYIGKNAFTNGFLYLEHEFASNKWNQFYATNDAVVYFKNQWNYDENGVPVIKSQ